jgi:hypothetical protein
MRRMRKAWVVLLLFFVMALSIAPVAANAQSKPPPGNSELDQYTETLPGPKSDQTIDPSRGQHAGPDDFSALGPAVAVRLQQLGSAGTAAAELAEATAPRGATPGGREGAGEPSGTEGVVNALGGSGGGLGIALPLIILGIAAAGVAFALLRGRARQAG